MFRISRLHELMKGLPRESFDRVVASHQGDKYSKGFSCWDQLIALVYGQLSGAGSLRELAAGFNSQFTHHYHLGSSAIRRSTLAEANVKRKSEVFADAARALMSHGQRGLRQEGERLLYLLDSTSITLKGRGFDEWTLADRNRCTQGLKLHVLYGQQGAVPTWQSITAANVNDRDEGVKIGLEEGAIYVFDKAYCDYNWWQRIASSGAQFVTRFKRNAAVMVERERSIPAAAAGIVLGDEIVRFKYRNPGGGRRNHYTEPLRRVTIAREGRDPLVLATNDRRSAALTIAGRYQQRWDIELFFKWIKQHLRIKRFLGRSENAVRIQILTALITYWLLSIYRKAHGIKDSLWHLLAELRATLFQRPGSEAEHYRRRREQHAETSRRQAPLFA